MSGTWVECETQSEVDTAVAAGDLPIVRSGLVRASGSATVTAYGTATVRAYDSATVTAYDSATVTAYGSATVRAYGTATVMAYGSATVRAYGSATVTAYGSATVTAFGTATVTAYGSATVTAYDTATVTASKLVPVHVFTRYGTPTVTGGIVLRSPNLDACDARTWLDYHGITVTKAGYAVLFKAVNDKWQTRGPQWTYEPGATVTAEDYERTRQCGQGLHLGATPHHAGRYFMDATRYVAVKVHVDDLIPLGDKAKVRMVKVLHEVTVDGVKVTS